MRILALDTSTKFLSVACLEEDRAISGFHEDAGIRHSEILTSVMEGVMGTAGWSPRDIELVCVGLGPGSFTGLRIAAATVKGLAAYLGVKVKGVPSTEAIARRAAGKGRFIAPFLDARKGKVYTCVYEEDDKGKIVRRTEDLLMTVGELLGGLKNKVVFFGDGVDRYAEQLKAHPLADIAEDIDWYPRAGDIGRIGLELALEGADPAGEIEPLYLHAKECDIDVIRNVG